MTLAHIRAATAAFSSHRGTASPDVRADDAALDAIATVRAEQRSEALLLYLILTEKTKRWGCGVTEQWVPECGATCRRVGLDDPRPPGARRYHTRSPAGPPVEPKSP
jgi:hypothetical protein